MTKHKFYPTAYRFEWFGGYISVHYVVGHDRWLLTQHPHDRRDERLPLEFSFATLDEAHIYLLANVP